MADAVGLQSYVPMIASILAIAISSLTLGWTIYRDAIRKPKFKVDVGIRKIVQKGHDPEGPLIAVEALNMGPIPNRVGLTFARKSWLKRRIFDRKAGSAMIYPDYGHRTATPASTRLEVGDQAHFIFPYKCVSYTQIFRSGAIEAVRVRVVGDPVRGSVWIPTLYFDRSIFEQLPHYLAALQQLDVPPPIVLMITLQGVRGARLGVDPNAFEDPPQIDRDVLELPEVVIEQYGTEESYQRTARPAFDALWNTGGYSRSKHFDSTGKWVPPR